MADQRLTRIAIVSSDKCKPKKCRQECKKSCPVVKTVILYPVIPNTLFSFGADGTHFDWLCQYSAYDLGEIGNSMQAFVKKMSSYEGAEVPKNRDMKDVDFNVDHFMKDMESVLRGRGFEDTGSDVDLGEGSLSDMDFDDSEDDSDIDEPSESKEEGGDDFMESYSDALNKELKATTLEKSFIRANEEPLKKDEGTSNATDDDMEEEFNPVDVDVNLVKSLIDSFSSQQGLPGLASNLLGLMGLQLPEDGKKGK